MFGGWVYGYLSGIHGNLWCSDVFGGIRVLRPFSMELLHYYDKSLKGTTFFDLTKVKHQNIKMSVYMVDKKHWVL